MKYKRSLSVCIALTVMVGMIISTGMISVVADDTQQTAPLLRTDTSKGVFFRADELNLSGTDISDELSAFVADTAASGMNTIYFEVKPSAFHFSASEVLPAIASEMYSSLSELDCLQLLTDAASEKNIQIYGVIDPFLLAEASEAQAIQELSSYKKSYSNLAMTDSNGNLTLDPSMPDAQQLAVDYTVELLEKYPVAGVVYEGLFNDVILSGQKNSRNYIVELLSLVRGSMPQNGQKLGLLLPYTGDAETDSLCLLVKNLEHMGVIDFTMTDIAVSSFFSYEETMDALEQQLGDATVLPMNLTAYELDDENFLGNEHQIGYRMCYGALSGIDGFAIDDTSLLREQSDIIAKDIHSDYSAIVDALTQFDLSFGKSLSITRPEDSFSTTYTQYFIMGLSDPDSDLTMNGEEVLRYGSKGAFGILVPLEVGVNQFLFEQDGKQELVEITRIESSSSSSTIDKIVQSSIYPAVNDVVYVGSGKLEFQCTAPSGAVVTGSVAGLTIPLQQTSISSTGTPAVFYGSADIPATYNVDGVTNLGQLQYTMQFGGITSEYTSNANLYVAGSDTTVKIMVNGYRVNVYNELDNGGDFATTLSEGAVDQIDRKDYWTSSGVPYFYASCGGYIAKSSVTILEGNPDISNPVDSILLEHSAQGETLRLSGVNLPAHRATQTEEGIAVHLYNTSYLGAAPDISTSNLIEKLSIFQEGDELLLDICLNDPLWGYDIQYDGTDTLIFIKTPPTVSDDPALPLTGKVIVLDPGHGDIDSGALGVAGSSGATENVLNLAVATATRLRLEQLGATVYMTREATDEFLELDERMQFAERYYPDFFLSIHHNSVGETSDANNSNGTEIYYHTAYSAEMSDNILSCVCGNTERRLRGSYLSYYRVTRITCAPSALLETGFVPNPAEYEDLCDITSIIEAANGICEGIITSIPGA